MRKLTFVQRISKVWKPIGIVAVPLALLPLIFLEDEDKILDEGSYGGERESTKFRMAYAMILMGVYWALELIPLPITALLPLILFPFLGIQDIYDVTQNYTKESNMIFLTGVIVALGLEYCNLHRRIALWVMTMVGGGATRLLWATMVVTAALAMWLSSTTCVVLVLPTVVAIIDEVNESPAVMSTSEARRRSRVSSVGGPSSTRHSRSHSFSPSFNGHHHEEEEHRHSSVFENVALVGPKSHTHVPRRQSMPPRNQFSSNHETPIGSPGTLRAKRVSVLINECKNEKMYPHLPHEVIVSNPQPKDKLEHNNNHNNSNGNLHRFFLEPSSLHKMEVELEEEKTEEIEIEQKMKENVKTMFLLGIAYAANIGGTAVITGAGPNKVFKEVIRTLDITQGGKYRGMTFLTWSALYLPATILNVILAGLFLAYTFGTNNLWFLRSKGEDDDSRIFQWKKREVSLFLRKEYEKLGEITYHEVAVGLIFLLVIILWIFRDPATFRGWEDWIYTGAKTGDSTGAMFGVILLFIIPKDWGFISGESEYEPLLDWKFTATKLPWAVLLLLGSGFALGDAVEHSGLSAWIGDELKVLGRLSMPVLLLIVIVSICIITEFVSNVACANIILPIMISISRSLEVHPLYLTPAAAVACSYSFMLPVANPTNTLVFAAGNFSTSRMAKTGLILNIICITVLYATTVTLGDCLFDFDNYEYPTSSNGSYTG